MRVKGKKKEKKRMSDTLQKLINKFPKNSFSENFINYIVILVVSIQSFFF